MKKKGLFLNYTGENHQSFSNKGNVPLSGGIFILVPLIFFSLNNFFLSFFIISIFLIGFFSDRKIVICREISKLYEEYIRLDINELKTFDKELKGELTVVISEKKKINKSSLKLSESDKKNIKKMINKLSTKEIVNLLSQNNRFSKKEIYNYCLKLKNEN